MQDQPDRPDFRIRPMQEADADRVIAMIAALSAHEGAPPPPMDAAELIRWSLGDDARFSALVAERRGRVVGYALFHESFHIGRGRPGSALMDLFVDRGHRRRGIARALLAAVARTTLARQGDWMTWQAHPRNVEALTFYEAIGARRFAAADFEMADKALERLIHE
ncbi:GNAT family N-acetyltransferase [Thalassobaculum sp. OXR-137]|uniref:GNAT family N-acetyltransferase n=1 Tax=Thalassobaculum sp. OXR-137 TaxID=3100173 RepID=UPI002AC9E074|nr:GNAT family N-acetyltransferase [Thalassobaculum sp. OXR-137]WPZ36651.1 GNAT family N-acetyltransferase [Thalassobaculum sp. OXR-137]